MYLVQKNRYQKNTKFRTPGLSPKFYQFFFGGFPKKEDQHFGRLRTALNFLTRSRRDFATGLVFVQNIIFVSLPVSVLVATAVGALAATFCRHFLACGHWTMIIPAESPQFKLAFIILVFCMHMAGAIQEL